MTYTINGDGQITVNMKVDATQSGMGAFLRVGSMMTLPAGFEDVAWYGNGPVETFNDRATNARQGIYENTVSKFFFPFMAVDDCGSLTDVKWIQVRTIMAIMVFSLRHPTQSRRARFTLHRMIWMRWITRIS